ncbi:MULTISPECIES: cytochrome d ubiquinol oxidase subunit II [Rhodomicrobium]|uniref:cytochrome d ubiquinol oxidase subunit II n=1 Tax=Rhodomicrobium TaxID=1068 RepID=UPI001482AACC|nr:MULTISPECIES: cytochrome d ubiquinol oxidase subunit II [Rhodomicrobium]
MWAYMTSADALPVIFAGLMGLSILLYVVLDGYDLGVGILMYAAEPDEKDQMISSIGPFWDANETWLVLGIGLLLVAFPIAHGIILTALYIPVAVMLLGLIVRGVAFDFRAKVRDEHKRLWDNAFIFGSVLTSLAQGFMLGLYIVGFEYSLINIVFGLLCGVCLMAGFAFIGACWLIMKTEHELQHKAVRWARIFVWLTALGLALVSLATPIVSERIFEKWFSLPNILFLAPIPLLAGGLIVGLELLLRRMPMPGDRYYWLPFLAAAGIFILGFAGLAYSFYPYVVLDRLTVWQAASAPASLSFILVGVVIVLPCILAYTAYSYVVFWGKVRELTYH